MIDTDEAALAAPLVETVKEILAHEEGWSDADADAAAEQVVLGSALLRRVREVTASGYLPGVVSCLALRTAAELADPYAHHGESNDEDAYTCALKYLAVAAAFEGRGHAYPEAPGSGSIRRDPTSAEPQAEPQA